MRRVCMVVCDWLCTYVYFVLAQSEERSYEKSCFIFSLFSDFLMFLNPFYEDLSSCGQMDRSIHQYFLLLFVHGNVIF